MINMKLSNLKICLQRRYSQVCLINLRGSIGFLKVIGKNWKEANERKISKFRDLIKIITFRRIINNEKKISKYLDFFSGICQFGMNMLIFTF